MGKNFAFPLALQIRFCMVPRIGPQLRPEQTKSDQTMKQTLSTWEIANALKNDENANWSHAGARALAEYLEEYEESTGEELELDVVAIRCDFSEFESLTEWRDQYFTDEAQAQSAIGYDDEADDDDKDEATREYIMDHGQLIEFSGGIIVSSF